MFGDVPIEIDLRERQRSESNHKLGQKAKVRPTSETQVPKRPEAKPAQKGGKAKAKPAAKKVGAKAKANAVKKARESYKQSKAVKRSK